ncbi:MAG: MFS transporter [Coriobacteriaceae bacterium]|nr:MFS transporter [Coriobacteriaceae bacterium]
MSPEILVRRRWRYLGIGACTNLFLGFIYGWSILAVPLQKELGWTSADTSLTFTLSTALFCVGGLVGAQITKKTSPRLTLLVSAVLIVSGYAYLSTVGAGDITAFHIVYGVCIGFSLGMSHITVLGTLNRWFPDRLGLSSGLLTLGFGLSSLVWGFVVSALIEAWTWRPGFVTVGAVTAAMLVMASFFVFLPPNGWNPALFLEVHERKAIILKSRQQRALAKGQQGVPTEGQPGASEGQPGASETAHDFTTSGMLRQPMFYLMFAVEVLLASVYLGIMGNAKLIALEAGAVMGLATLAVGCISLGDSCCRLASGIFFDRFGYRASFIGMALLFMGSTGVLFTAFSLDALPLVFCGILILGMGFGTLTTVLAATTNRFYGQKHYGTNLSVVYTDFLPASLIGPTLVGFFATTQGSYHMAFAILFVISAVALLLCLALRPPRQSG